MELRQEESPLRRVHYALRAAGVKPEQQEISPLRNGVHSRGYLPHVKREGASYFVTFRLADSLPQEVLLKFQSERAARLRRFFAQKEAHARGLPQQPPAESPENY